MASWIIHLRIAQGIYKEIDMTCIKEFIMGNIAPDSGIPTVDGKEFLPSAEISHFRTIDSNGIKDVHEDLFIAKYFTENQRKTYTAEKYFFYFGYLTHLITDKLWAGTIVYNAKEMFSELFNEDNAAFWRKVKQDWYDLDFMYLKRNPQFEAFRIYESIDEFKNNYLDFFADDSFEKRKQFITAFYNEGAKNVIEHDTYLSMNELDEFVKDAIAKISSQCSMYIEEIKNKIGK